MCYTTVTTTVKLKPLETATMFRLLQQVESSWKTLADYLLKDKLQDKIAAIEADCFHDNSSENALHDVFAKWRERTVRANRTWQTLCVAANKCGDNTLEPYIKANGIQSECVKWLYIASYSYIVCHYTFCSYNSVTIL